MAMQGRLVRQGSRFPFRAMVVDSVNPSSNSKMRCSSSSSNTIRQFQTSVSRFTTWTSSPTEPSSFVGCSTGTTTWYGQQQQHHDPCNYDASMWTGRRTFATTTATTDPTPKNEENTMSETTTTSSTVTASTETETPPTEPENVLASLPEGFTPGQAVYHLHKKGTAVTLPEIRDLVKSVVPGKRKHASVLRNALKEYKRTRGLVIGREEAALVLEATLKALQPPPAAAATVTGQDKLKNALIVLDMFVDPSTGLYFSSPTPPIDNVLALLLEGIIEENLPRVEKEDEEEEDDDDDEDDGGEVTPEATYYVPERGRKRKFRKMLRKLQLMPHPTPPKKQLVEPRGEETPEQLSERVAETTRRILELLNIRKSRPYRKMKKRAAKSYLKQIRIHHGPTPHTVHLATQIMWHVRGSATLMEDVVSPCQDNRVPIKPETFVLIEDYEKQQQQLSEESEEEEEDSTTEDSSSEGDDNDNDTTKE